MLRTTAFRAPRATLALLLVATGVAPAALHAQADDQAPATSAARAVRVPPLRVLAFTDTAGARIEVQLLPGAAGPTGAIAVSKEGASPAGLAGAAVRATITPIAGGAPLWSGELGRLAIGADGAGRLVARTPRLAPARWSPQSPALYRLAVDIGGRLTDTTTIGFRTIAAVDGVLHLNGRPLFLRGNAINPPERNLPDSLSENPRFARDYLRYMKSIGVNVVRFTRPSQAWMSAADEVGMLVFQGHYGTPEGGTSTKPPQRPLAESEQWYRDRVIAPQANHPSVVLYALSNEQAAPEISYLKTGHAEVAAFLGEMHARLSRWDDTRLYIGNAGYGFGRGGEVCDIHRYWGWYYNSALSFYTLRDPRICWRSDAKQPITLTEAVGNYTGPDGRYNLASNTKQPESQLNWTGHAPDAEQGPRAMAYQAWVAGQGIEITRRLRARNPYLAGLLPFTIVFHDWHGITKFADMRPKPVAAQYARSFQPVLLSWELWTPQVYAGSTIAPTAHVVNDAESGADLAGLSLRWTLADAAGRVRREGTTAMPDVRYFGTARAPLSVALPADLPTGRYTLAGVLTRGADTLSRNHTSLWVAQPAFARPAGAAPARRVVLLDDSAGATGRALTRLGLAHTATRTLGALDPARDALVIGDGAWGAAGAPDTARLRAFVAAGGRVLLLPQRPDRFDALWLPARITLQAEQLDHPEVYPGGRPFRNGMAVNPERPAHPVFAGLDRDRLFLWSDWTRWDDAKPGFPEVYPVTRGFVLADPARLDRVAVLANYDHGLEGVALAELFDGRGSVLVSGFDVVHRAGLDPAADRLLGNMVRHAASAAAHDAHPLVDSKITWGDYASERGLVTGIYNGLLLHTVPVVPEGLGRARTIRVDSTGFAFAGAFGGWNTNPSIQYVGRGRRPYGPFTFTLGGAVRLEKGTPAEGEGRVWLRVPAGRRMMTTVVHNQAAEAKTLHVTLNGTAQQVSVPAGQTITVETPLAGATTLALTYRGDRRLVLLETDFR
jgi:hypothetical protein